MTTETTTRIVECTLDGNADRATLEAAIGHAREQLDYHARVIAEAFDWADANGLHDLTYLQAWDRMPLMAESKRSPRS